MTFARTTIRVEVTDLPQVQAEFASLVEQINDLRGALFHAAASARQTRDRLRGLAFTLEDEAVLRCEEIEDRALGVIDKWARREDRA